MVEVCEGTSEFGTVGSSVLAEAAFCFDGKRRQKYETNLCLGVHFSVNIRFTFPSSCPQCFYVLLTLKIIFMHSHLHTSHPPFPTY